MSTELATVENETLAHCQSGKRALEAMASLPYSTSVNNYQNEPFQDEQQSPKFQFSHLGILQKLAK